MNIDTSKVPIHSVLITYLPKSQTYVLETTREQKKPFIVLTEYDHLDKPEHVVNVLRTGILSIEATQGDK